MRDEMDRDQATNLWAITGRWLAALLVIGSCAVAYYAHRYGEIGHPDIGILTGNDVLLLVVGFLGAAGFLCLVCFAFGICRFALSDPLRSPVAKLLNHMPAAIVITDSSDGVRYMNAGYRRLGSRGSRNKGAPHLLLTHDAKAGSAVHRLSRAIKEGRSAYEELQMTMPLDAKRPADSDEKKNFYVYAVTASPMEMDGETLAIWSIADITHLRNKQETPFEELQEAVSHLDHAPAGFISWNEEGRLVYLNATLARWCGLDLAGTSPERFDLEQLFGAEKAAQLRDFSAPSVQNNPSKPLELTINTAQGSMPLFGLIGTDDKIQNGLRRALLIPQITSELEVTTSPSPQHLPVATKNMAENFIAYLDACPVAMAALDKNGSIIHANARFSTLFAQAYQKKLHENFNKEFIGETESEDQNIFSSLERFPKNMTLPSDKKRDETKRLEQFIEPVETKISLEQLVHPRDQARLAQMYARALNGEMVAPFDTIGADSTATLSEEGQSRHIRLFIAASTEHGIDAPAAAMALVCAVEITDQRTLEQQVEQGQKMQAVGQLAGGIAHDFNNVLTAIIMSCDLLLSSHRSSDPSHPDIMNIKNNANRAAALVRQLLAFSRRQTLRPEVLDLTDMLADSRLLLARLVGMSIGLKIDHGRDLWPVLADQAELERVMINLAANAHDAMPEGGTLTIRTANIPHHEVAALHHADMEEKDYVLIEVEDTGSGIAPEIRGKIFEPFFTTKEVGKGTGLGLSMVHGIVAQTGGTIHCRSKPGEGTTFSIYLPRHIEMTVAEKEPTSSDDNMEEQSSIAPPAHISSHLVDLSGSATILVVEDEDAVRMGSVKALQSRGYQVFEASTGTTALQIIEERDGQIDLIVSDVVMPEMDGPTLLKELRRSHPDIKFIFVSGYAEDAFAKNLPHDAQFTFLPKPFSLRQLATTVKEMLEASSPS